jgi:hypothetical protein
VRTCANPDIRLQALKSFAPLLKTDENLKNLFTPSLPLFEGRFSEKSTDFSQ